MSCKLTVVGTGFFLLLSKQTLACQVQFIIRHPQGTSQAGPSHMWAKLSDAGVCTEISEDCSQTLRDKTCLPKG